MTTAVDTGILLDILRPNPDFVERSAGLIESSSREGPLVICDLVYAELAANFETRDTLDAFLHDAQIRFDPADTSALFLAGRLWRAVPLARFTRWVLAGRSAFLGRYTR